MNLFIEGIPGMGKSTLLNKLAKAHPAYRAYREGDYCPVELGWCTYMTAAEYAAALEKYPVLQEEIAKWTVRESGRYIVSYTRIITDEPGFHKYMEQFEIYQGRKTREEFAEIILGRYEKFFAGQDKKATDKTAGNLFECAFFQNILEELILFQLWTDEQIFAFYRKLHDIVKGKDFRLIYLYDENVEKIVEHISSERSDAQGNRLWYQMMLRYLQESPYGKLHAFRGMEDVIAHFKRRQNLELRIIREILGEHAMVLQARVSRLKREFFTRDGITVAKELLGKIIVHETPEGTIRGIITEVESYMGENDKGSHTYGGRRTERTEPMYHIGGTSYVYLIYGMYSCMNVACMTDGIPQAVLLRSVIPADEESRILMTKLRLEPLNRRQQKKGKPLFTEDNLPVSLKKHLADGPGKMCIAMDITRADNDIDMVESEQFYFTEGIRINPEQIKAGKRIGIDYAEEAADYLWRFYVELT